MPRSCLVKGVTLRLTHLVPSPAPTRAGDEVTISYGPWPNEPFLLLFGFVPGPTNPHDSLLLFRDAREAAAWCLDRLGGGGGSGGGAGEQQDQGEASRRCRVLARRVAA